MNDILITIKRRKPFVYPNHLTLTMEKITSFTCDSRRTWKESFYLKCDTVICLVYYKRLKDPLQRDRFGPETVTNYYDDFFSPVRVSLV